MNPLYQKIRQMVRGGDLGELKRCVWISKYHHIEVEDEATIYAEYENGATASFVTTTREAPGTNRLEITGDRGKLVAEDGKLAFWKLAAPEREHCFTEKSGFETPACEVVEVKYFDEAWPVFKEMSGWGNS